MFQRRFTPWHGPSFFKGMRTKASEPKKEVLRMHAEIEHLTGRARKAQIEKTERAAKKLIASEDRKK
jgi:hypothetical protein